ncbi:hypothetical protein PNOK_0894900 [Pyrrhoderma noxium]|uniref:Uncharacterized protein n=1 Tax=Pyrrhoderma noxium TaxID=2282107 RepID=A0A286U6I7_9AGAM|nr:hypothetical protein PNOK_0894900 [Pyrrhoderma noxium]
MEMWAFAHASYTRPDVNKVCLRSGKGLSCRPNLASFLAFIQQCGQLDLILRWNSRINKRSFKLSLKSDFLFHPPFSVIFPPFKFRSIHLSFTPVS